MPLEEYKYEECILNLYKILGIERTATQKKIKKAYRDKMKQWHPDKLHGMAAELQSRAKTEAEHLNLAHSVLSYPEKREKYDKELEGYDPLFVTTSKGISMVVMSMHGNKIDLRKLLGADPSEKDESLWSKFATMFGFNQMAFDIIRRQYEEADEPSEELRQAWKQQLESRNNFLNFKEKAAWDRMGINQENPGCLGNPEDYLKKRKAQLEETIKDIKQSVDDTVKAIAGNPEATKLLTGVVVEATQQDEKALVDPAILRDELTEIALKKFDQSREEIEELAKQRAEVLGQLSWEFTKWEYYPEEQDLKPNVTALMAHKGKITFAIVTELIGNNIKLGSIDEETFAGVTVDNLKAGKHDALIILNDILSDSSLIIVYIDQEQDFMLQASQAIKKHLENLGED